MNLHLHLLAGCVPDVLAHYLKALGILRLVGQRPDRTARALWRDDVFHLSTSLAAEEVEEFFLRDYAPTPLVSPWNAGSGFYPKDSREALDVIAAGASDRFAPYREAIALSRAGVGSRKERPQKEEKAALVAECRARWPQALLPWLNAALVMGDEDLRYPALLGTGGNDGRLDFTNNQMQRLVDLFDPSNGQPRSQSRQLLRASLWGSTVHGLARGRAIGQFLPGGAGGPNATSSFSGDSLINPWDYVLALEGAVLLQTAAVRRLEAQDLPQAAAPFAVRGRASGYPTATSSDETNARGEQWMPIWSGPATLSEIEHLFREGRLQGSRRVADTPATAASGIARLGAARGVSAFVRFGYVERNGQANLAVPLGRWRAPSTPRNEKWDEVIDWTENLHRAADSKDGAPAGIGRVVRRLEATLLDVLRHASPDRWQQLIIDLGEAEAVLTRSPRWTVAARLRPLPPLPSGWLKLAADGTASFRLAAAVASLDAALPVGPFRIHCAPLEPPSLSRFAKGADSLLANPSVVWTGFDLVSDLIAVAKRRLLESARAGVEGRVLQGAFPAPLPDLRAFVEGDVDDDRISRLARGLAAVDWRDVSHAASSDTADIDPVYAILRLAHWPSLVPSVGAKRVGLGLLRTLEAGRMQAALAGATRRLAALGVRPALDPSAHRVIDSSPLALRLAAAMAIPITQEDARALLKRIQKPSEESANP